jgi:hypothetical protein
MQTRSTPIWSNCLLVTCFLVCRGKSPVVVAVTSFSWWFPWHFIALTKQRHAIHFQTLFEHDHLAPLWFKGIVMGVGRRRQDEVLAASGRRICFAMNGTVFLLLAPLLLVLLPPLCLFALASRSIQRPSPTPQPRPVAGAH